MHKINKYNFVQEFETYFYLMDKSERNVIGCQIEIETVLFCKMNFIAYPMDENTAHSHKMETSQMETIPHMETFLIYQTTYKTKGFWKLFFSKIP